MMVSIATQRFARTVGTALALSLCIASFESRAHAEASEAPDDKSNDPAVTPAQREEARTRFARGTQLYDEGEFKLALIEFERAYSIVPNYRMLYNIGQVQQQLGQFAKALLTLQRYLTEGGSKIPAARRTAVDKDIATLRTRTANLTVQVAEPGAEISLDGNVLGMSPLPPDLLVDVGEHRIVVTKAGFRSETRTLVLAGGDSASPEFALQKEKVLVAGPTPVNTPMWVAWGTTGALAIGAGVTGIFALRSAADLETQRTRLNGTTEAERTNLASTTSLLAAVTDGLAAGAIVAGGVALYLTLTGKKNVEPARVGLSGATLRF
jgi:hypothetical protein